MSSEVRRTQAERSALTRDLLMQATVDSLVEVGYRSTSLQAIEARSGVSHGALMHQFASRSELLVAAVQHLARRHTEEMRRDAAHIASDQGIAGLIDLMWRQYRRPTFYAFVELWNAARTDRDLHAALVEEERALGVWARQIVAEMFGLPEVSDTFASALDLTVQFMRGAALTMIIKRDIADQEAQVEEFRKLIEPLFMATIAHQQGSEI